MVRLGVTNVFALLRLQPMSSRDKEADILALRHQPSVLQRQLSADRIRFTPPVTGRCWLHCCTRSEGRAQQTALGGAPGYRAPLAPRCGRSPARPAVPAPAPGAAAHFALDPRPGAADGPRESRAGVSPGARRTAGARGNGRRFHGPGRSCSRGVLPASCRVRAKSSGPAAASAEIAGAAAGVRSNTFILPFFYRA